MEEIELSDVQRFQIEKRCMRAIERTEDSYNDLRPRDGLREELVGSKSLVWTMTLYPFAMGIFALFLWRWIFDALSVYSFLVNFGIPSVVANNIPEVLALFATASMTSFGAFNWGAEGRVQYATMAENADHRASVLYSVLRELSDTLPGAVPDMSEYQGNWDDHSPNDLIDRALGRFRERRTRPAPQPPEKPFD
ncbi:hypothetical protein [Aestuariivita boseongensis]|uniref:hypothetical protein n=1 Tax=Aestuariivita boseongensis TaxID=1470562 RepID=UPI00068009CD|nr:hypothetical protein [Aestuariivita boseongensis]